MATNDSNKLPSAYKVAVGEDGRFYPMRFGQFRKGSRGRIGFDTPVEAATYCWREQAEYERLYPAPSDTPKLVNVSDPHELQAHVEDDIRAAQIQRLLCCVCPSCAVVRSCYPDWQPPSVKALHKSEYDLARIRGICSHPDCTLAIETYCSVCRTKLCREHLGHQQIGAEVVCVACRQTQPQGAA